MVTRGEQLTRYKSGLNMKKWFAPVTFVQKKKTLKKSTLLLVGICLFVNLVAPRLYQLNRTAHKWGGFFRFYMYLIKVLLNNIGRLYLSIGKNFK